MVLKIVLIVILKYFRKTKMAAGMIAESTSRMVKQRSMEALDKLRTYTGNPDSRYMCKYYMYTVYIGYSCT